MYTNIPLCRFCGGVARDWMAVSAHSREVCEARILERIAYASKQLDAEVERLNALRSQERQQTLEV